jgi:hypothetical protein
MATSDVLKQAVFDARVVQLPPRYAVEKGALSVASAPFRAISATSSQHSYQINVPSQNVFVDRAVDWSADVYLKMGVITNAVATAPILAFGNTCALSAFPLHELTQTMTATINDTSVVINTDTVLHEVLRLTDYKKNRLVRHCPTMLDRYKSYQDSNGAINSPLSSYFDAVSSDEVPNGAWGQLVFTNPTGGALVGNGFYVDGIYGGANIPFTNGIPVSDARVSNDYSVYVSFHSSEKLVLSPFIFADSCEYETGLFGINNIQLVMNMKSDPSRVLRIEEGTGGTTRSIDLNNPIQYNEQGSANGAFVNAAINIQFLTPSLDLPLPQKSVVPYTEFPRYITTGQSALSTDTLQIQSQTIVLPQIPDMLLIYCKPSTYASAGGLARTPNQADWYFPISQLSVNFDNFAGLMSSMTVEQLYQMSAHNGLEMDWNEWNGKARVSPSGNLVQTVGGFLVIRPGVDFGLQAGQAPSIIGNYTLQFQATIQNYFGSTATPVLYVIAVNSGFFETLAGSSRIIKGVLSEADVISAEPVLEMSRDGLKRIVGNGFFNNIGSFLSKAVDIYTKTKPAVSAIKGVLPDGRVKDILGKVGYGGPAGAGVVAGAGKKSLSARLM